MPKKIDYTGRKYGHLVLLSYAHSQSQGMGVVWLARCDCGTIKEVNARSVKKGQVKTCGNCEYTRRLMSLPHLRKNSHSSRKTAIKSLWVKLNQLAVTRRLTIDLTPDQFSDMITKNCSYCGKEPSHRVGRAKTKFSLVGRLNSAQGYTLDNCTPTCKTCADMKRDSNYLDFLEQVILIANHINQARQA